MAAGTLVRRVLLQIKADDGDTEAKLDKIGLKADELAAKHPELKVRIDTAAASAKVAILREELRGLSRQADAEAARGGILSRLLGGFGGGFSGMLGKIPGLPDFGGGGGAGAGEGGAGGAGSLLGSGTAIGALIPVLGAALVEADGLASGFAAAGAGAGAFYLLAHPAINNLQSDVKSLSSANQALGIAQQKYLIDPTKAHAKTLHEAQVKYQAVYQQMGQDAGGAAKGVLKLHDEYVKLSTAFQPEAFKVFNGFLKLANDVLPYVTPFARTFADAISGLLGQADRFAGSKGFKDWLSQFHGLEGPSIRAIGEGIGHVAVNVGKLFTIMSAKDVANAINIAFSVIDGAVIGLADAIKFAMMAWNAGTAGFDQGRHYIAHTFDSLRHTMADWAHVTASYFDEARANVHRWWSDVANDGGKVISFFGQLPGRILHALGDMGGLLVNAGAAVIHGFLSGLTGAWHDVTNFVGGIASWISSHKGPIEADRVLLMPHGVAIMEGLFAGLQAGMPNLAAEMRAITYAIRDGLISPQSGFALDMWLKAQNARLKTLAAERAKIHAQIAAAEAYAANIASNTMSTFGLVNSAQGGPNGFLPEANIISNLQEEVRRVRSFAADIKKLKRMGLNNAYIGQLLQAGPVQGGPIADELANGPLAEIAQINAAERSLAAASTGLGQLGADILYDRGPKAGRGFLSGLEAEQRQIAAAMQKLAEAIAREPRRELKIEWVGGAGADQQFLTWLKRQIRIRGGNPAVLGL